MPRDKNTTSDEGSTKTLVKEALAALGKDKHEYAPTPCGRTDCHYDLDKENRENWLDSRFLKTAGVIIGVLSPLFVWIIVSIFEIKENAAIEKQKQTTAAEVVIEVRSDIKQMKEDISSIKLMLAKDNRLSWIPKEGNNTP